MKAIFRIVLICFYVPVVVIHYTARVINELTDLVAVESEKAIDLIVQKIK